MENGPKKCSPFLWVKFFLGPTFVGGQKGGVVFYGSCVRRHVSEDPLGVGQYLSNIDATFYMFSLITIPILNYYEFKFVSHDVILKNFSTSFVLLILSGSVFSAN